MGEEENFSPVDDMTALLPYLSEGFCDSCRGLLESRLQNLNLIGRFKGISLSNGQNSENSVDICSTHTSNLCTPVKINVQNSDNSVDVCSLHTSNMCTPEKSFPSSSSPSSSLSHKNGISSWGSLKLNGNVIAKPSPESVLSNRPQPVNNTPAELGDESDEQTRFSQVGRTKDFSYMERVGGKQVNVLKGLELHTKVFSPVEQMNIVDLVYSLQRKGQEGKLRERTYSEPSKWKRGKGRVTLQFGCCYNYAVDKKGNPPGIMRDEDVDPLPLMFKAMIKRLVRWHVLPLTCVPNSCIVNIYDEGDCIPPHIDHHDFVRPFCTVSFLTECDILFGAHLSVVGDGEFSGPVSIPLPVGSVLILSGNGADVAKHCVPGVPAKRISITFRKMDDSKLPYKFLPDPELLRLQPLRRTLPSIKSSSPVLQASAPQQGNETERGDARETNNNTIYINLDLGQDNFPPLGSSKVNKRGSR